MYSRVPLDEDGAVPRSSPRRAWLPWVAFIVGILATIGYYERRAFAPHTSPPNPDAPLTQPDSRSYFPLFKGLFQTSSQNSDPFLEPSSLDAVKDSSKGALSSELENTRASLFTAQRVADERGTEVQELRSELDGLRAAASSTSTHLSQCQRESSANAQKAANAADDLTKALSAQQQLAASSVPASAAPATGSSGAFDIDSYRESRLAATQPNIIECAEANEGESQEACHLPPSERFPAIGQKGATVWMTGLSGAGKSTVARALERKLVVEMGLSVQNLDGDNVRTGLNRDLGFTPGDRAESVRRVGEMACLFSGGGVITLVTLVSPYRADRDAARKRHEEQGIPFLEVLLDVPLSVVQSRDPKGLYAKAASGELKGMTGMSEDAPYEPPTRPEVVLPTHELPIEESVAKLMTALKTAGVLSGGPTHPLGLPLPYGTTKPGQFLEDELTVTDPAKIAALREEAAHLPQALVSDIEVNWLQVIGEGWAAPLRGFLREGPLMQVLHFNSLVSDPFNRTGAVSLSEKSTDWNDYKTRGTERVGLSVPIVLPATGYTKRAIEGSGKKAVALVDKDGRTLAILRNPEVYPFRKEEVVTRCFGAIDRGHPYINHLYSSGDFLIGGEVTLLGRVRYHDGLDKWRLSPKELYAEFEARNADVVYAFQTRNPTHAGHAYLMKTGLEKLKAEQGFKRPLLWLSPLGGWTKSDDVPLDVRVKQHQAIIDDGMLDEATTVMAIWPAPMIYAGPTEVQFHASSRRNGGAAFFVVGRDAAGMKGSLEAEAHPDDDLYKGEHARYVLQMSPVLEDREMGLISFDKFYYDTTDHEMKAMDPSRPDDFISISGSKMRALARQGATPCPDPIPNDLLEANCVPQGFMVQSGWDIVCDYYQRADDPKAGFLPWSKAVVVLPSSIFGPGTQRQGQFGATDFRLFFTQASLGGGSSGSSSGSTLSPWHDIPLLAPPSSSSSSSSSALLNMVVEIPMHTTGKMEVSKALPSNPITQDVNKGDGSPRYYGYGSPFFNYGMLPQTWEDPSECEQVTPFVPTLGSDDDGGSSSGGGESATAKACGDDDPLDVIEVGSGPLPMGAVVPVKVLGSFKLLDEGEVDYKVVVLRSDDADAWRIHDMASLEAAKPGTEAKLADWLTRYKTAEGKGLNALDDGGKPAGVESALGVVAACHKRWFQLAVAQEPGLNAKQHFVEFSAAAAASVPSAPLPLSVFLPSFSAAAAAGAPPTASVMGAAGGAAVDAIAPSTSSSTSSSSSFSSPAAVSSAPSSSGGGGSAAAPDVGSFSACMALCRSLGEDAMRQECVSSCIGKYGRRMLAEEAAEERQGGARLRGGSAMQGSEE